MSKLIKQMEMDDLKNTFQDVRDMVILSASRVSCQADAQLRATLRKKNIRLKVVKNSLARRVFGELNMKVDKCWEGPTMLAWFTRWPVMASRAASIGLWTIGFAKGSVAVLLSNAVINTILLASAGASEWMRSRTS